MTQSQDAETLARQAYITAGFDRAGHRRSDADWLARQLAAPAARYVPVWRGRSLIAQEGEPAAQFVPALALAAAATALPQPTFLGVIDDAALFALDLSALDEGAALDLLGPAAARARFRDLRQVGAVLGGRDGAVLAYARALGHWRSRQRFCGVCGAATAPRSAGHVLTCTDPACSAQHFPRTDPATIMLISDGERCLLGRQPAWPAGMYSALAGFVEPGESLEDAVIREVREEAGIEIADLRYFASQPWPFPQSLMLGFTARATTTDITIDTTELEDARWFTRPELAQQLDRMTAVLPRVDTIARRMINAWMAAG